MNKSQKHFSCKEITTTVGKSDAVFNSVSTKQEMKWIFIIPRGTKINSELTKDGGTVSFRIY